MLYNLEWPVMGKDKSDIDWENMTFSFRETDKMYISICKKDDKWSKGVIQDFQNLNISPAAGVLNYGQGLFEGMKAYRTVDGSVVLFRPQENAKRMQKGARRLGMPEVPEDVFMEALATLVKLDEAWVPHGDEASLYIRPFMIATDSFVGVRSSDKYTFSIFTCPVGAYYKGSVKVKVERHFTRATPGGTGYAKAAGNYAGSLYPSQLAREEGYDQLIWTDALTHEYVEESGTMNAMFVVNGKLVSPQTSDTILNGVTRDSVIALAKDLGIGVEIRKLSVRELENGLKSGDVTEAFGVGTAATIKSIEAIGIDGKNYSLDMTAESGSDSVAFRLSSELDGIRRGKLKDRHEWNIPV